MTNIGKFLHEIAQEYRNLDPVITRLRKMPDFKHNTFLPNPLSPIIPVVAHGYKGKYVYEDALDELTKYKLWDDTIKDRIESLYKSFQGHFKNNLLWFGWNYWEPTSKMYESDKRRIQLMCGKDKDFAEFINDNNNLLISSEWSISKKEIVEFGKKNFQGFEGLIKKLKLDEETQLCRNYADGIWELIFTKSIDHFKNNRNLNTIVDFVRNRHISYIDKNDYYLSNQDILKPVEVLFLDDIAKTKEEFKNERFSETGDNRFVDSFILNKEELNILWSYLENEYSKPCNGNCNSQYEHLINSWTNISDKIKRIKDIDEDEKNDFDNLLSIVTDFAELIKLEDKLDEAYIILQHFCFLKKAMFASCQYAIPIIFGSNISVMYLSFKEAKPLPQDGIDGWKDIGYQLFSSLFIEHLSNIQESHREIDRRTQQRLMLQHSLPKLTFKPFEYFTINILKLIEQNLPENIDINAGNKNLKTEVSYNSLYKIKQMLYASWFLSGIGQQELSLYAKSDSQENEELNNNSDTETTELIEVCQKLNSVFHEIKHIYINGMIDSFDTIGRKSFRKTIKTKDIDFKPENISENKIIIIKGNESIVTMHLFNLIDNAMIHSKISPSISDHRIKFIIDKDQQGNVSLKVRSPNTTITSINDPILLLLNKMFSHACNTRDFHDSCFELSSLTTETTDESGFGHEGHGYGLIHFSKYLYNLWENEPRTTQPTQRGIFKYEGGSLYSTFYFPHVNIL